MLLHPRNVPEIPEETVVVVHTAFFKEDLYMRIHDEPSFTEKTRFGRNGRFRP